MAKLTLDPNPTFSAKVAVPLAGGGTGDVVMTFKHMDRDQLNAWATKNHASDEQAVLEIATGWDLVDPFDADSLTKLFSKHMRAARAIIDAFLFELTGHQQKN